MCHSYTLTPATVFQWGSDSMREQKPLDNKIIRSNASAMKELWPHCQHTCWTRKRGWMRVDFHTTCFRTCQKVTNRYVRVMRKDVLAHVFNHVD